MTDDLFPYLYERFTLSSPVDFTYIGIGSCPHVHTLDQYTPSWQQIFPPFLQEFYAQPDTKLRLIHFDPYFQEKKPLLEAYFQSLQMGFLLEHQKPIGEPVEVWTIFNHRIEIVLVSTRFEHPAHDWFLEGCIDFCLQRSQNEKVILQEFTGHSLASLRNTLYFGCPRKEQFRNQILVDFTYGFEEGCYQDLTVYKPFQTSSGDFLNLLLESDEAVLSYFGKSPFLDSLIQRRYYALFQAALNTMHVEYRRAVQGNPVERTSEYRQNASPDEIMAALQKTLRTLMPILQRTRMLSQEGRGKMEALCETYKAIDMYAWNQQIRTLVKFEPFRPKPVQQS